MAKMTAAEMTERWFQAQRIIAQHEQAINNNYDKTIIGTIIDHSKREQGIYTVLYNDTIELIAMSDNKTYRKDDQVYITVPQGDFKQNKIIIGKHIPNENQPLAFISPLESYVSLTDDIDFTSAKSILANGENKFQEIAVIDFSDPQYSDFKNNADYNNIGLSAKFKCHFNNSIMTSGRYGIQLDITGILKDSENTEMTFERNQYALMSDVDMFGDPYKFNTFFTQSKMIDIRNIGQISKIVIYLYQDQNFKYYDGETSKYFPVKETYAYHNQKGELQTEVRTLNDNIFVSDISLSFGNNVIDIENNSVKIYTLDHLTFDKDKVENDKKYNDKDIYLIWYNKDDALQFIGFSDGVVDKDDAGNVIPYDEDAYQQEKASQMAGASVTIAKSDGNIPKIKEGLQIYKNAKQFNDYFQDLFDNIKIYIPLLFDNQGNGIRGFFFKEYYDQLNEHDAYKSAVDIMNTIYCRQENLDTGYLVNYIFPAIGKVANLNPTNPDYNVEDLSLLELYIKGLQYYGEIYDALKENKEANISSSEISAMQYFNTAKNNYNVDDSQNDFRSIMKNRLESPMTNLREQLELIHNDFPEMREDLNIVLSFFDQVVAKYTKILDKLDILNTAQADQVKSLQNRFTKPITDQALLGFQEEYDAFLEANKNRYCVYWYRYNLGYEDSDDRYLPKNWKRLIPEEVTNSYGEIAGMPQLDHTGEKFAPKSDIPLQVTLDHYDRPEEKFKAVVIFNHNHYFSNELVFSNENPDTTIGLNNIIYIKLGANSRDAYPLYNNNYELTPADRNVIRELSVHYNNTDGDDTPLIGSYVYWYIPKGGSLLIPPGGQYGHNDYLEGQKGFTYLNKNDELLQKHYQFYRDDCECYFKPIGEKERINDDGTVDYIVNESDLSFYYIIANTYTASAMNNKIVCQVVKENTAYEDDQSFTFGQSGTSGTQYTLQIDIIADQKYQALKNGDTLEVQGRFFDYDHRELIGDECPILTWRWADGMPRKGLAIEDNDKGINYKYIKGNLNPETQCLYNVLECIATWDKIAKKESSGKIIYADEPLTLRKFLPIPYVGGDGEYYADCPTRIIYTQFGSDPIMDCNKPLRLYDKDDNQVVDGVIWEMYYYLQDSLNPNNATRDIDSEILDKNLRFLPKVEERVIDPEQPEIKDYYVTVLNMYIDRLSHYPVIVARKAGAGVLWAQPLYITYGKNGSDLLNNWDESLVIDENNGTILSTMVGAGFKDSNNTFHGVLMGDVRSAFPNERIQPDGIGIYGFHEDAPSFGFKIDGTGFIGKSGCGRIIFNGQEGIIGSALRLNALNQKNSEQPNVIESGMLLDFDNGIIDILGPPNGTKQSQILIQEKSPYFTIKSNDGNTLMYVGNKTDNGEEADYYLQSNDFSTNYNFVEGIIPAGVKFDLKNGKLIGYDFDLRAIDPITRSEVRLSSSGDPYFKITQSKLVDDNWESLDLITVSKNNFMMHSSNWDYEGKKGTQFNLNSGNITSFGFDLKAFTEDNKYLQLSSNTANTYPLNINGNFKVRWDGHFEAKSGMLGNKWYIDGDTGDLMNSDKTVVLSPSTGLDQDKVALPTSAKFNTLTADTLNATTGKITTLTTTTLNGTPLSCTGQVTFSYDTPFTTDGYGIFSIAVSNGIVLVLSNS